MSFDALTRISSLLNAKQYASYPDSSMNFGLAFERMQLEMKSLGEVCLGLRVLENDLFPDIPESATTEIETDPCLHRGLRYRPQTNLS